MWWREVRRNIEKKSVKKIEKENSRIKKKHRNKAVKK
jgi:hypothetical protein